ncbi:DnaJ domain-containing protein [Ceratocystis lukuohia]|uniref:DnaJ domain-containing protein n=1 Tax=Ceratocystis lukuohia TaxID=2019550 RepID=A0ABR4MLH2_9PEZI
MPLHTPSKRALPRLQAPCLPSAFPPGFASTSPLFSISHRFFFSNHKPSTSQTQTHYDVLAVPVTASPAAIKKAFYALSKTYHPDLNPDNPSAKARFLRISEAYAVLSVPAKRSAYDRSIPAVHRQQQHRDQQQSRRGGSYSSSNPAGGRPPSGLSNRKSAFTGPPPSFYRAGGWSTHYAKRQAAQDASTSKPGSSQGTYWPGTGPGPDPLHSVGRMAHFNAAAHFQTHMRQQVMLNRRRAVNSAREKDFDEVSSGTKIFLILAMMVGGMVMVPLLIPTVRK